MMSDIIEAPVEPAATIALPEALTPAEAYAPNRIPALLDQIEREARALAEGEDATTPVGRKRLASLAYKVARTKTALDDMGKAHGEELYRQKRAIDDQRRTVRDRLSILSDEVRAPVTAWETAETTRKTDHEVAIAEISTLASYPADTAAQDIADRLARAGTLYGNRDWQEYADRAAAAREDTIRCLTADLERVRQAEAERAELERLRAAEATRQAAEQERQRKEREAQAIAHAAERARLDAEAKAQAEIERAAHAKDIAEEAARVAVERAKRASAEAVEAERRRVAEQERREKEEADRRAANKARRAQINRTVRDDLAAAAGLTPEQATAVVTAVAQGHVRHLSIAY